jgi:glycosyltransferase involved in cell wall biosynthesis
MSELVTIVTATTATDYLKRNIESVQKQTYTNFQHLIFIDGIIGGPKNLSRVQEMISNMALKNVDFIPLPYSVGHSGWNGHRMYMAALALASDKAEYICFLDEDNYIDEDHIESLYKVIKNGNEYAFSLRKIVDKDGNFVVNDDCESLGLWHSILHPEDYFIDLNCFFLKRLLANQLAPIFYRKARDPNMQPEIDRALSQVLRQNNLKYDTNYKYTLNYTAGNTQKSVQKEFFLNGNQQMLVKYNGSLPWVK